MPEMDGLQATRYIRDETSPVINHQIPIIAITANAMRRDQEACLQAGMNDYISKPFDRIKLIEKIAYWVVADHTSQVRNNIHPVDAVPINKPETTAAGSGSAPIEFDDLYQRLMDDHALGLKLLKKMDARLENDLAEIKRAVEAGDSDQTRLLAHKLKGSAGILSAEPLRRSLEALEAASAASSLTTIAEMLDDVYIQAREYHLAVAKLNEDRVP